MAVHAGQILWDGNGYVIDRIQTGGVSNFNLNPSRVYEVGDYQTVGIVYDIPDLTFEVQSDDVSTDIEANLLGLDPASITDGQGLDFISAVPLDVISPFRSAFGKFSATRGVIVPYLNLEQVQYRFGLRANAEETFTLRGDSEFFVPGTPYMDLHAGGATSYNFTNGPAIAYTSEGDTIYAVGVDYFDLTDGTFYRLFWGQDYTDTATGITLINGRTIPATATVRLAYGSAAPATYPQSVNKPYTVKPAALRSKDFDVYVGLGATPTMTRLTGVQSFEATRRVTLQNDEEFGNSHYVAQDYDYADVSGTVNLKAVDVNTVVSQLQTLAGIPTNEIVGPVQFPPLELELALNDPNDGHRIKTLYCDDAQFTPPPVQGRVNQKLELAIPWNSLQGHFQVFKGHRPGGS